MTTEKSCEEEDKKASSNGRKLRQRVEEFKLWSDDQTFKSQEYERRRMEKIRKKGAIKADTPLRRARAFYIPSVLVVLAGSGLLLYSSIDALSGKNVHVRNSMAVKIVGGVVAGLGIVALMATAAYTYHREDKVRKNNGFPTLFESSRVKGGDTLSGGQHAETMAALSEFKDKDAEAEDSTTSGPHNRAPVRRMVSEEEKIQVKEPLLSSAFSQLRESSSSASSTISWLNKHEPRFHRLGPLLRRQSSDSALDQSFARSHLQASSQCSDTDLQDRLSDSYQQRKPQSPREINHLQKDTFLMENKIFQCNSCRKKCSAARRNGSYKVTLVRESHPSHCCNSCHEQDRKPGGEEERLDTYCPNCQHQSDWANCPECPGHQGVCASSTDSSGYTSSECYHVVHPENTHGTVTHTHGSSSGPTHATLPVSRVPTVVLTVAENCQKFGQTDKVFSSTAAVHATWTSTENDSASLSPPASPDISSLPYLCKPCLTTPNLITASLETTSIHTYSIPPAHNTNSSKTSHPSPYPAQNQTLFATTLDIGSSSSTLQLT